MAKPRDLELNTLERYYKRSDRLVLESYSSCEVPLGCGGSLVRWVDPEQALPLVVRADFGNRKATVLLDGEEQKRSRFMVSPAKHVLALIFERSAQPLSFRLSLTYETDKVADKTRFKRPNTIVATADDGTWFATTTEPSEPWLTAPEVVPGFVSLRAMPPPRRDKDRWIDHRTEKLPSIGMSTIESMVWVRKVFSVRCDDGAWVLE